MRKTWIVLAVTGWLVAGVLWYGGHIIVKERDTAWDLTGDMQLRLQFCIAEKVKAQSALQMGCFKGKSL